MRALDRFWPYWLVGGLFVVALQAYEGQWLAAVLNAVAFAAVGLVARASHREQLGLSSAYTRGMAAWTRFALRHPWLVSVSVALVPFALLAHILGGPADVDSALIVFGVAGLVAGLFAVTNGLSARRGPGRRNALLWLDKHSPDDALDRLRPKGWYIDPTTHDRWRWWDGSTWTDYESAEWNNADS